MENKAKKSVALMDRWDKSSVELANKIIALMEEHVSVFDHGKNYRGEDFSESDIRSFNHGISVRALKVVALFLGERVVKDPPFRR